MVLITIDIASNGKTIYFDQPIENPRSISLISCSLYNTWLNLKSTGYVYHKKDGKTVAQNVIPPGHYTVDTLADALSKKPHYGKGFPLIVSKNTPGQALTIVKNTEIDTFAIDENLCKLLGAGCGVDVEQLFTARLNSPRTYYIHCDLVESLKNGRPSSVLACVPIAGESMEFVSYPQQPIVHNIRNRRDVNSLEISVKDRTGAPFDFNSAPLHFVLEIM